MFGHKEKHVLYFGLYINYHVKKDIFRLSSLHHANLYMYIEHIPHVYKYAVRDRCLLFMLLYLGICIVFNDEHSENISIQVNEISNNCFT